LKYEGLGQPEMRWIERACVCVGAYVNESVSMLASVCHVH